MTKIMLLLMLTVFLIGCQQNFEKPSTGPSQSGQLPKSATEKTAWRNAQETDIYETVLRHGLKLYGKHFLSQKSQQKLPACTFFLTIKQKDPSNQFMARFTDEVPVIRKGSELIVPETDRDSANGFFAKTASLGLGDIEWRSDTEAKVDFWAYVTQRAAASWEFIITRGDGRWIIQKVIGPRAT